MQQKRGYVGHMWSYPRQIPFWLDLTYNMQASTPPCVCSQLSWAHINLAQYLHTSGCIDTWLTSYCHPPCRSQTAPVACLITGGGRSPECTLQILWLIHEQWSCVNSMNHVHVCRYIEAWLNAVTWSGLAHVQKMEPWQWCRSAKDFPYSTLPA